MDRKRQRGENFCIQRKSANQKAIEIIAIAIEINLKQETSKKKKKSEHKKASKGGNI